MEYRHLGDSGLLVSEISLGSWLTYGGSVAQEQTTAIVQCAYEQGINFFDTANKYQGGEGERTLGNAIKTLGVDRSELVIATKLFLPMGEGPNNCGLSRKHIMEQCDSSLQRLGLDYIDVYQCHRPDPATPIEETLRALDDLVRQGKIIYIGVSEWTAAQLTEAVWVARQLNLNPIVSNQPQYSLLWRRIEEEVLPVSKRYGIGQVVFSPLAQGVLTGKYSPGESPPQGSRAGDSSSNMLMEDITHENALQIVEQLKPIADDLGLTLAQLALAWVLREPGISSAIIGASRPEQIDDNIAASGVHLDEETIETIANIIEGVEVNSNVDAQAQALEVRGHPGHLGRR